MGVLNPMGLSSGISKLSLEMASSYERESIALFVSLLWWMVWLAGAVDSSVSIRGERLLILVVSLVVFTSYGATWTLVVTDRQHLHMFLIKTTTRISTMIARKTLRYLLYSSTVASMALRSLSELVICGVITGYAKLYTSSGSAQIWRAIRASIEFCSSFELCHMSPQGLHLPCYNSTVPCWKGHRSHSVDQALKNCFEVHICSCSTLNELSEIYLVHMKLPLCRVALLPSG